ncbi:MAG: 50S ribosomal protein L1 [Alphaproteobacteria bacterium]|nr:50S ribosomal protein L1 [Alphaproteobacteria bacterium]
MKKVSKRMQVVLEKRVANKIYAVSEALSLLKETSKVKFDETVEVSIKLGVDPRKTDQNIRGMVGLPNGTGKKVRVAVITEDAKKVEASKKAGADLVGGMELIDEISKGKLDFEICIATPDMMPKLAKVAKILGPKGLMPNPKLGTVSPDPEEAVKTAKAGQVEYRTEKGGIVHAGLGKLSFDVKKLEENLGALMDAIRKAKPEKLKGVYIQKVVLSSTMGAGFPVEIK